MKLIKSKVFSALLLFDAYIDSTQQALVKKLHYPCDLAVLPLYRSLAEEIA